MAIETPQPLLSYDDYVALPDDGQRYQVIDGVLVMSPSPTIRHQRVAMALARHLEDFVRAHKLGLVLMGPADVVLVATRPAVVLQPDVFFVRREKAPRGTASHVAGAPDLAVEVLSPSNARLDRTRKAELYAAHGVRELWLVPHDVDRVEVLRLGADGRFGPTTLFIPGQSLETDLLPGFQLDVAAIFPPDDEEG